MTQVVSCASMPEGQGPICTRIGSPSAFPGTPAHSRKSVPSTLYRQLGRFSELLPHEKYGNRLGTFPQEGAAHLVALARSTHLVPQGMSRGLFLPLPFH